MFGGEVECVNVGMWFVLLCRSLRLLSIELELHADACTSTYELYGFVGICVKIGLCGERAKHKTFTSNVK